MGKQRRRFSQNFKLESVKLVREGGLRVAQAARDLEICEASLRRWIKQHEIDERQGPAGALTTEERSELARLRREVRQLKMEREILRKATVSSTGHRNTRLRSVALRSVVHGTNRTTWPL